MNQQKLLSSKSIFFAQHVIRVQCICDPSDEHLQGDFAEQSFSVLLILADQRHRKKQEGCLCWCRVPALGCISLQAQKSSGEPVKTGTSRCERCVGSEMGPTGKRNPCRGRWGRERPSENTEAQKAPLLASVKEPRMSLKKSSLPFPFLFPFAVRSLHYPSRDLVLCSYVNSFSKHMVLG